MLSAVEPNNYIKVSWGLSVVGTFLFNDKMLLSASRAHKAAVECLDRALLDAAGVDRDKTNPRAPKEVVRMSLFRPCSCFEGILNNHVGVWRCPKCLASFDECKC